MSPIRTGQRLALAVAILGLVAVVPVGAQQESADRLLEAYGPVYDIDAPEFATPVDLHYRVAFDVAASPDDRSALNPALVTPARFLRMHDRAGVPGERLDVVVVVHGGAGKDMLSNEAYRARYGVDNPNAELLQALQRAGARIVLCGQTAAHRDLTRDGLASGVQLALSAMTALITLQAEGYALIAF